MSEHLINASWTNQIYVFKNYSSSHVRLYLDMHVNVFSNGERERESNFVVNRLVEKYPARTFMFLLK